MLSRTGVGISLEFQMLEENSKFSVIVTKTKSGYNDGSLCRLKTVEDREQIRELNLRVLTIKYRLGNSVGDG